MEEDYDVSEPLTEAEQALLEATLEEVHKEIPENSKSVFIDESTSRFSSAIWYEEIKKQIIMLAGIGGIGSYVAFLLARMKPKSIFMYDSDVVEAANMSGQLYGMNDIEKYKVYCITDMISNYADYHDCFAINERYTEEDEATDIMICGFDNMTARKTFFTNWVKHVALSKDPSKCLFIDGRLAAEEFQIFAIQGNDERAIEDYKNKWLFDDREAIVTICSYKQTTFCANMIASYMVNLFVNFIANQCNPLIPRDVPYYTTYNAETMYFKTEA